MVAVVGATAAAETPPRQRYPTAVAAVVTAASFAAVSTAAATFRVRGLPDPTFYFCSPAPFLLPRPPSGFRGGGAQKGGGGDTEYTRGAL